MPTNLDRVRQAERAAPRATEDRPLFDAQVRPKPLNVIDKMPRAGFDVCLRVEGVCVFVCVNVLVGNAC